MNLENKSEMEIYNLVDDLISITDESGTILCCNDSFSSFFKKNNESLIGLKEYELFQLQEYDFEKSNKNYCYEKVHVKGNTYFFQLKKNYSYKNQSIEYIINIRKNITKEESLNILYEENKNILKQIAEDEKLNTILKNIINSAEKMNFDMKCSILLLDKDKKRLLSTCAPSIPEFFSSKINGMLIGEKVGSCGAAAFLKERIIVDDVQSHENWHLAKELAKKANLYACWSQPIFSSKGDVLGTFAMYYSTTKEPTQFDLYIIEDRANLAGIAIEKYNNEIQLKENVQNEKKQQELLMHKTKQAMMGEMIENIAHQWRQPLSIISTSATGIKLKKDLGILTEELEKKALSAINDNAQYLSKTIDDFRNYFKSENVEYRFNLYNTFSRTLKLIDVLLKNRFIEVVSDIDKDIELTTLENELVQVFMNIFNNSVDEFETKEVDDKFISIKAYNQNGHVVIKINDSAGGAKEEIVNRVFEPYFSTKHKSHGTGIGLYMCKEMIEKHMHGTIEAGNNTFKVNDLEYKGLEFTITLPLKCEL